MTLQEVFAELQSLGNASTLKVHKKNGADDNMFGVKMGDIRKVAAKIKSDDALATELWSTGNLDARLLAVLLFKPANISRTDLDAMVRAAKFHWLADWLNSYIIRNHPDKETLRQSWMNDADPWAARGIGIHFPEHRRRALAIGEKLGVLATIPYRKVVHRRARLSGLLRW